MKATILLIAAALLVPGVRSERIAPMAIKKRTVLYPSAAAGSGLRPEVAIRLEIDVAGKVSELAIRSIEPSSRYDEDFLEEIRRILPSWRFAPALVDGEPEPATFEMTLVFARGGETEATMETSPARRFSAANLLVADHVLAPQNLRIMTRPLGEQREAQARTLRSALEQFSGAVRVLEAPAVRVHSDHYDENFNAAIRKNILATWTVARSLFEGTMELGSPRLPLDVVIYSDARDYRKFVGGMSDLNDSDGIFMPPGLIAMHAAQQSSEELVSLLIHEATHAFVARELVRPGIGLPTWLSEGLADYLASSAIDKGKIIPGKHRVHRVYRAQARLWMARSSEHIQLKEVETLLKKGKALSLEELVNAERAVFYGDGSRLFYPQSWLLVHYLRHGQEDWAERFAQLVFYVAEGFPAEATLKEVYGGSPESLEDAYRAHIKGF